ncbi:MAG TPA: radical SAM protein, partial [Desulfobacteraceae bacterium]|nr:radical SAM protein [Desulfobacteraceae bacterium]
MKTGADDYRPSYIKLYESGELQARRDDALASLTCCRLCPRSCGVNRVSGETGFCGIGG